jgi:hypothetical protein
LSLEALEDLIAVLLAHFLCHDELLKTRRDEGRGGKGDTKS